MNDTKKIRKTCVLPTDGYKLMFYLLFYPGRYVAGDPHCRDFQVTIRFLLNSELEHEKYVHKIDIHTVPTLYSKKELLGIANYFEKHIADLIKDSSTRSRIHLNYTLTYRIQALSGKVNDRNEGNFGINCLINVSDANKFSNVGKYTYIGGYSTIKARDAIKFTQDIHEFIDLTEETSSQEA